MSDARRCSVARRNLIKDGIESAVISPVADGGRILSHLDREIDLAPKIGNSTDTGSNRPACHIGSASLSRIGVRLCVIALTSLKIAIKGQVNWRSALIPRFVLKKSDKESRIDGLRGKIALPDC